MDMVEETTNRTWSCKTGKERGMSEDRTSMENEENSAGFLPRLLKRTRKYCNERLLILQPHEHNREREWEIVLCAERNATKRAAVD